VPPPSAVKELGAISGMPTYPELRAGALFCDFGASDKPLFVCVGGLRELVTHMKKHVMCHVVCGLCGLSVCPSVYLDTSAWTTC